MLAPPEVDRFVPRLQAIEEILHAVAAVFGIPADELLGPRRSKTFAEARLCAYLVARSCTRLSYPEIGAAMGRDHTTVMAGVSSARRMVARDPYFAGVVGELSERFGEIVRVVKQ